MINIFNRTYYPLNKITISKSNLVSNYEYLSKIGKNIQVAPVLKSNAYGHGIVQVAKILDNQNAPMFCVDSLYEAYQLLKGKTKTSVFIMGYINPRNLRVKKLPFSYAVYDLELLHAIDKYQKGAEVHIKVDTGMHRLGVPMDMLENFLKRALNFKNIKIVGLMSHFASADDPKDDQNAKQIENYKKALKITQSQGLDIKWKHIANSDGLLNLGSKLQLTNLSRTGLALYGIGSDKNLKPVLELTSQIVQIKKLKTNEKVGYSGTFQVKRDLALAVLPIGYNDGVERRLSNKGYVEAKGVKCQIAGRVSMNITAIDITGVKSPKIGDKVTIYSRKLNNFNSVASCAQVCETIPYELLVHLSPISIRREIIP